MAKRHLIQLIHVTHSELDMDEGTYRQMSRGLTGRASTEGMDITQPDCVLESMKRKGFRTKPAGKASSSSSLDNHPQPRKIRALWLEMIVTGTVRDRSENASARQIKRETGISTLRWLSTERASSVIEEPKRWQRRATGVEHKRPESVPKQRAGIPGGTGAAYL